LQSLSASMRPMPCSDEPIRPVSLGNIRGLWTEDCALKINNLAGAERF
jgi:hypothetical protein